MRPIRSARFSHGWFCFTLFLLSLTWTPVKLEQSDPICQQAPRVPSITRCTRCTRNEMPKVDVGAVENPLPPSTEYCLKWINRLEIELEEAILNLTVIHTEENLGVARLIGTEEIRLSQKPLKDCRKSETPKTNPLNDKDAEQCLQSESDEIKVTCASQMTDELKRLIALLSTEAGKQSLPSCDDFENYNVKNDSGEWLSKLLNDTSAEASETKRWVMRERHISDVRFRSSAWVIDGKRINVSQSAIGYGVMENWFSRSECPNDPIFGGVNVSTSNFPHLNLVADATFMKGWNSTEPGLNYEQTRLNLSRTSGNESLHRMDGQGKKLVASFTSDECRAAEIKKDPESYKTDNTSVDIEGNELHIDLLREAILMNVEQEMNEIAGEIEEEIVGDLEKAQRGCKVSDDEYFRLGRGYGVFPNVFARTVVRHQTISPVYCSYSNRTLFEPSPYFSIDVVEQKANSSALPSYNYTLAQVNHRSVGREWERVVETGVSSSMSVTAEMGATLLDDYKKTFTFFSMQGPLLVKLDFKDRNDFKVRIMRPLKAWELVLELRVLEWTPLHATFSVDETDQFLALKVPTHPVLNATVREAEDAGKYAVTWEQSASPDQLAGLLDMAKGLIGTVFGKTDGAPEGDNIFDLMANFVTGSTKEEQRRGEEIISRELTSVLRLVMKKLTSISPTAPQDPATVEEILLASWRVLWDLIIYVGVVEERGEETPGEGEFLVDFEHLINFSIWFVDPVEC